MRRIFTLGILSLLVTSQAFAQLPNCPAGASSGTLVPYSSAAPAQTFTTAAWGTTSGSFTYSAANQNYQTGVLSGSTTTTISSPSFTGPSAPFIVGARISPGNRVDDYQIAIIENGNIIACSNGSGLTTGNPVGIAASFAPLTGRTIQVRFTFLSTQNNTTLIFDDFYSDPQLIALPVTFISFDAQKATTGTQLTWKVGTENNVKLYEVEKSINGGAFVRVGFVSATGASSYSFTDAKPAEGTVLYRIKNVDYDGRSKYSSTINFKNGLTSITFKAFPLPAQNLLTVQHTTASEKAQINIASTDGKIIRTIMLPVGATQTDVNLTGLKSGMYLLRFASGKGKVETMKILKQ